MPIKPENKTRYPVNWKEIRARILERAGHKCERCNAPNRTLIARGTGCDTDTYMDSDAKVFCSNTGEYFGQTHMSNYECTGRWIDIVLTIAHLDHQPENCADDNLKALCQRCHLLHDQQHHQENAKATRRSRKALGDLFAIPSNEVMP